MNATQTLIAAADGGVIGDGRTGANLALGVGLLGVALGWFALSRFGGRIRFGNVRTAAVSAIAVGLAGTFLAVLHLATSDGGPGTGNGQVGAIVAIPLGLVAMAFGGRVLTRTRGGAQARR
ncbi:hypothetical protein G6045_23420 [Streptomyces sp. YC504]|uniref:Uncharacterized protein n=1 Tax=Streptomyces mesophilus TaxID=1775132 RepID=A0A6G4XPP5_9ACTN|nr:DUF6223 family protein [Streptomyces mesophilus]NGO78581.1 hypothetical protein [Streptomyces mesophilus]